MRKILGTLALTLIMPAICLSQDFSDVHIKAQKVAGNVYMLEGAGGNIGVSIGEDGIVLIDDQFAPLAPRIREALRSLTDQPIRFILNTHWHNDHTNGNRVFASDAPIVAQENVRSRLKEGRTGEHAIPPAPPEALPIITFDHQLSIWLNGEQIRVLHLPHGHTDGDSVIFFSRSNVIHMGDDFFAGHFPFIDLDSGGSVQGLIDNVQAVIDQAPPGVKIIPGHGSLSTLDDLKKYEAMLRETTAIVRAGIAAGKTAQQLEDENALEKYAAWSWDFIPTNRFIETLYRDLK